MTVLTRLLCLGVLIVFASAAQAHKASDGFVYLDESGETPSVRVDLALRDLALVVPLDANADQQIRGRELSAARPEITRYIESGLSVHAGDATCALNGNAWGLTRHSDGPYASARYQIACPDGAAITGLTYTLLFDTDSLHRGLLQHTAGGQEQLAVLSPDSPRAALNGEGGSMLGTFLDFLWQGVIHLVLGYDHVLFLIVLILPATMVRRSEQTGDRGVAVRRLWDRLWELGGIITAFTVAHSITLGLAALDVIRPPITWIEIIIALSIAMAAINLFFPLFGHKTWRLAFGFGLIHGFGFASVLGDLTSGTSQKVLALAGFNLGVEAGQLALVALLFPVLYAMSRYRAYQRLVVPAIALIVSIISLNWAFERFASLPPM
ncbi:HupE/UreJ family protein [Marinobacter fonticola]|uniref:HupE/UreJ family protein n=1 Tax=Marinobacter fonticola TaxID=2603215 RepID=UPI001D0D9874|nr:HupE/UreJ family protein [Marinobacter fonticola]